jgi:mono/diheme cytochrome c family protein
MRKRPSITVQWLCRAVGVALLLGQPMVSVAQEEEASIAWGKDLFLKRCASCHGEEGKGNGPAAVALKNPPADLTQISKKMVARFPART